MDKSIKFVSFDTYCPQCEEELTDDHKSPCNECLECSAREGTNKPLYYKEKER